MKEVETFQSKLEKKTGQEIVTHDENVCQICHKTKFTDGAGKECKYCNLKVCSRCGVEVSIPGSKQVSFLYLYYLNTNIKIHIAYCSANIFIWEI